LLLVPPAPSIDHSRRLEMAPPLGEILSVEPMARHDDHEGLREIACATEWAAPEAASVAATSP
jgi:hypothetical protein